MGTQYFYHRITALSETPVKHRALSTEQAYGARCWVHVGSPLPSVTEEVAEVLDADSWPCCCFTV